MNRSDFLVLLLVVVVIGGLVLVFAPGTDSDGTPSRGFWEPRQFEAHKVECMNNVRNLVGLIEVSSMTRYPKHSGANLLMFLVARGDLDDADKLAVLFCPGDRVDGLEDAGGVEAYHSIDLKVRGEYDHMTSYAGRDQHDVNCAATKASGKMIVLVCDDSEDHHDGRGFVFGFTGGAVKWRDKVRDWRLDPDAVVAVGEGTLVRELECMRAD